VWELCVRFEIIDEIVQNLKRARREILLRRGMAAMCFGERADFTENDFFNEENSFRRCGDVLQALREFSFWKRLFFYEYLENFQMS